MSDNIIKIGQTALEAADAKVKAMMDNIVNAQTPGYRKTDVVVKSFPMMLDKASKKYEASPEIPKVMHTFQNTMHGTLLKTGGSTDVAIGGDGYFALQGEDEEIFTRDGRFNVDQDGRLVSVSGNYPVLGHGGPIVIIPGSKVDISPSGDVMVDGIISDRIRIVNFKEPEKLDSINSTMFKASVSQGLEFVEEENPRLLQGFIETSNVNMMESMMDMIYLGRIYGMDSKIIQTRDATLSRAIEMGRAAQ